MTAMKTQQLGELEAGTRFIHQGVLLRKISEKCTTYEMTGTCEVRNMMNSEVTQLENEAHVSPLADLSK